MGRAFIFAMVILSLTLLAGCSRSEVAEREVCGGEPGIGAYRLGPGDEIRVVVEAVGDGLTEFAAGDSVVSCFFPKWQDGPPGVGDFSTVPGDGVDGYAREAVVRPATWFTPAPRGFSHAEAATLTTAGLTAWRALVVDGRLKAGDVVLVLGTGGVSIFALQLAKTMGATVIATSSSDEKLERVRAMGADPTINYRQHEDWARACAIGLAGAVSTMSSRSAGRVRSPNRSLRYALADISRSSAC
jgi:NADPH:quinone reductase-like Zn-dependent oxidoreductase